jgi:HoxN/HupN/NixA family high-affinity nickel-transporter
MYIVGFLFGLGFDTATEIALLGIIAIQSLNNVSAWIIMPLPCLFTCGMSLIDTIDGIVMAYIYGKSFINPIKKIYYNLISTKLFNLVCITFFYSIWIRIATGFIIVPIIASYTNAWCCTHFHWTRKGMIVNIINI